MRTEAAIYRDANLPLLAAEQKSIAAHNKTAPFYYVEYGLAQRGAVQVWRRSPADERAAVHRYLDALALGGPRPFPELFAAAGASFAFDPATLADGVSLIEQVRTGLDPD